MKHRSWTEYLRRETDTSVGYEVSSRRGKEDLSRGRRGGRAGGYMLSGYDLKVRSGTKDERRMTCTLCDRVKHTSENKDKERGSMC